MPSPHITFLDIATMDAGDLDFSGLESLGSFQSFPTTAPDQVIERLLGTDVAIINKIVIGETEMAACPDLKLIQLSATGYNNVDLEAARRHGITVCNVSGYSTETVTQHTIGLMLNLVTSIHRLAGEASQWCASPVFSRLDYPASELAGKALGLAGSGDIGSRVAEVATAIGMHVQFLAREGSSNDRQRVSQDDFLATSDVISLHCPLTETTRHMINAKTLQQMKPTALLINTGRGDLVDEAALAAALQNEIIAGAGLDVLSKEPPATDNPLILMAESHPDRLIITPHSAWTSTEARTRLLTGMIDNIKNWQSGTPSNEVS